MFLKFSNIPRGNVATSLRCEYSKWVSSLTNGVILNSRFKTTVDSVSKKNSDNRIRDSFLEHVNWTTLKQ